MCVCVCTHFNTSFNFWTVFFLLGRARCVAAHHISYIDGRSTHHARQPSVWRRWGGFGVARRDNVCVYKALRLFVNWFSRKVFVYTINWWRVFMAIYCTRVCWQTNKLFINIVKKNNIFLIKSIYVIYILDTFYQNLQIKLYIEIEYKPQCPKKICHCCTQKKICTN